MDKRPNTKGLISRRFRKTTVMVRIIDVNTEQLRSKEYELIDKGDAVKIARERTRLQPGEMILRATITEDKYVLVVMTPEEFLFRGRVLEYTPYTNQEKETQK